MEYVTYGDEIDSEIKGQVNILIKCTYNFNLRLSKFLQKQLGIQRKTIDKLIEDKIIDLKENIDIKKYRYKKI